MNPLLQDAIFFLGKGKKFLAVRPSKFPDPIRTVDFEFTENETISKTYECTPEEFTKWWSQTCTYVRSCANAFPEVVE